MAVTFYKLLIAGVSRVKRFTTDFQDQTEVCSDSKHVVDTLTVKVFTVVTQQLFQSRFALADDRADLARITAIVGFNFAGLIGLYFIVYTLVDLKGSVH